MDRRSPLRGTFGTAAAAAIVRLSPAMVDYLCRSKVVVPSMRGCPGRGRARLYTFGDLVALHTAAHLLEAGVSVAKLKKGLQALQSMHPEIAAQPAGARFLVTDGTDVYFRTERNLVEDLSTGQFAFRFVVELQKLKEEVARRVSAVAGAGG